MGDGWWVGKGSPGQRTARAKAQGMLGKAPPPIPDSSPGLEREGV